MNRRQLPFGSALAILALLAAPTMTAAMTGQGQEDKEVEGERRVLVDVVRPQGHAWGLRSAGYLGVHLVELTPELRDHFGVDESSGVMVGRVAEDSPASRAGLAVGDIITAVDGEPARGRGGLARMIARREAGATVSLDVFRDGAVHSVEAEVEERRRPQLWLDSLHPGQRYSMHWRGDDGDLLVVPDSGAEPLEIRRERLDEVMGNLHERLSSPEFSARMLEFRSNTEELEKRIKELEERLQELSAQLEKLEE